MAHGSGAGVDPVDGQGAALRQPISVLAEPVPYLARHRSWKEASRRADDAANAIDEMLQACLDVPLSMRTELERLERDAAEKFSELTNWLPPKRGRGDCQSHT